LRRGEGYLIIAQPIGVEMPPSKYTTRAEYLAAIANLHQRARRSGWDLTDAPKQRIAGWLRISRRVLDDRNREHGLDLDDIRTGSV
jgi:hypothetical protein